MSGPASYSFLVYRGDSFRVQFALWADAAKTQPVDLTGVTVAAEVRSGAGAVVGALSCTVVAHVITATLTPTQSRELPAAAYWDLQLTYANGDVRTIVAGRVDVHGDVTGASVTALGVVHG